MKKTKGNRIIKCQRHSEQWKAQQLLKAWAERLDRLPDAAEVRRNPLRSAPTELTEMLF